MKKLFLEGMMLLIAASGFSQESIIFKGTVVPNSKDREVTVLEAGKTIMAFPVKPDNTFYGEVPLTKMKQLLLRNGSCGQTIFAKPGREITINFGDRPMTATFTGSPETEYYIDMRFTFYPGDVSIIWSMPWHVYKKYGKDALAARKKYSDAFCLAYNISPAFKKEVENYSKYSLYGSFITWPKFYLTSNNLAKFEQEEDWRHLLDSLFAELEWNDPFLCDLPAYVSFAEYYLNEQIKKSEKPGSFILKAYDVLKEKIPNRLVRDFFQLHYTKKYLKDESKENQEKILAAFKKDVSNPKYIAQLPSIVSEVNRFGIDAPAYDFTLEDISGKKVTLSSFRGKVVYLDFWATWCGPCLAEVPHMNEMKKELKNNKDIVVICISTDEIRDKEKWKNKLKEMDMDGYQLFAGEDAAEIKKAYNIRAIPHFVMIGKDGKIYKNMTIRPSNPQTKSVLEELAKSK